MDAGTPITNTHYIGAPKGEIYGADHNTSRFTAELNANVRPQTPLKNLYLTGGSSSQLHVSASLGVHAAGRTMLCVCVFVPQARTCLCAASPALWPEL